MTTTRWLARDIEAHALSTLVTTLDLPTLHRLASCAIR